MNPTTPKRRPASPRRQLSRASIERIVLLCVVAGSLVIIWSSVSRFRSVQQRTIALQQKLSRIQADIDLMSSRWPSKRTSDVERRFAEVPDLLLPGNPALTAWIDDVQRAAPPLALEARISVTGSRSETNSAGVITVVQAQVEFPPSRDVEATRPLYPRLVEFAQRLVLQPQRVDLVEANLSGGENSMNVAYAVVEIWTAEPLPSQPLAAATP